MHESNPTNNFQLTLENFHKYQTRQLYISLSLSRARARAHTHTNPHKQALNFMFQNTHKNIKNIFLIESVYFVLLIFRIQLTLGKHFGMC